MENHPMPTKSQAKTKVVKPSPAKKAISAPSKTEPKIQPKPAKPTAISAINITKKDLITRVATKTGLSVVITDVAINATFQAMKEALLQGERIELRNFGVFEVKPRKGGLARNPKTGEEVPLLAGNGKTVRFKMGKELKS
jgi:DNA-binding protein HU-beta